MLYLNRVCDWTLSLAVPDLTGYAQTAVANSWTATQTNATSGTATSVSGNFGSNYRNSTGSYWTGSAAASATDNSNLAVGTGTTPTLNEIHTFTGPGAASANYIQAYNGGFYAFNASAATSSVNQVAPNYFWRGSCWAGASTADIWTTGTVYTGSGTVWGSILDFAHSSGCGGTMAVRVPNLISLGTISVAAARKGTFVCTAAGTITISNTNELVTSDVVISLNTAGGTVTTVPAVKTVTSGTGFTVLCGASDTSTYNYDILN